MPPFKTVAIISGIAAALSILALPLWILGIPSVQNKFARGWSMGLEVILAYPVIWAFDFVLLFLVQNRLSPMRRAQWQNLAASIIEVCLCIAIARSIWAWRLMIGSD